MRPIDAEDVVLEGVVIPVEWTPSGEVLGVVLMTFDEKQYGIDPISAGDHSLKDHLRKHVRLSALIQDGHVIQVRRVEVLGSKNLGSSQPGKGRFDEHDENAPRR